AGAEGDGGDEGDTPAPVVAVTATGSRGANAVCVAKNGATDGRAPAVPAAGEGVVRGKGVADARPWAPLTPGTAAANTRTKTSAPATSVARASRERQHHFSAGAGNDSRPIG
ncbi:MAG: hypothetical protein M3442_13530, partial [Chloroflexota bacterium]|nr:hypothetical protein [Chloroflexota bacterium]